MGGKLLFFPVKSILLIALLQFTIVARSLADGEDDQSIARGLARAGMKAEVEKHCSNDAVKQNTAPLENPATMPADPQCKAVLTGANEKCQVKESEYKAVCQRMSAAADTVNPDNLTPLTTAAQGYQSLLNGKANSCRAVMQQCVEKCINPKVADGAQACDKIKERLQKLNQGVSNIAGLLGSPTRALRTPEDPSNPRDPTTRSPTDPTRRENNPPGGENQPRTAQNTPPGESRPAPSGGGGGLGGLGQLLPLAMMAMMMANQPDQEQQQDPMAKFCAENPDSQVCQTDIDCTDTNVAALNPMECLCKDPAQARVTPICNQKPTEGVGGSFTNLGDASGRGQGLLGASAMTDLLGAQNYAGGDVKGSDVGVDANQTGGSSGGPNAVGGPPLNPGDGGGGAAGPGPYNTDVMQGVEKGGGGGTAGGGGGGYRYGGGASSDEGEDNFDLKQFLPSNPSREIAGMSIEAKDGLTGPFGPSIWEKISNRYRKMQPFLKP